MIIKQDMQNRLRSSTSNNLKVSRRTETNVHEQDSQKSNKQ